MSTLSADRQVRYHTHREVVFPGKEFMVEKYGLKSKVEGQKSEEDGQGSEVEGNKIKESKVKGQKTLQIFKPFKFSNLQTIQTLKPSNFQTFKIRFWWLWYGYRWYSGLRGLWLVITGTSTSSVTKK
jgi:hypothetical protein